MNSPVPTRRAAPVAISEDDKNKFVALIRSGYSIAAASAITRPHTNGPRRGRSSFDALMARDSDFRQRVEDATEGFRADLIQEAIRRGVTGFEEELSYRGLRTGDSVVKKSDAVLLKLLSAYHPEQFATQTIHHAGRVDHVHAHMLMLDPSRVRLLSQEQRNHLANILPILCPPKDDADVTDAEFEVLDDESDNEILAQLGEGLE